MDTTLTADDVRTAISTAIELESATTTGKVLVADLFTICRYVRESFSGTLDEFKAQLLVLYKSREIVLSKIDIPSLIFESYGWAFYERCLIEVSGAYPLGLVSV